MGTRKPKPSFHDIRHLLLREGDKVIEIEGLKADLSIPEEKRFVEELNKTLSDFRSGSVKGVATRTGQTLVDLINAYCADQNDRRKWTAKSSEEVRNSLQLLAQFVGEKTLVSEIDRELIRNFTKVLAVLPPNISKKSEFKGKSLSEIASSNTGQRISTLTLKKHTQRVSGLFNWAVTETHLDRNPAQGLAPKAGERAKDQRTPFSEEDIRNIFRQLQEVQMVARLLVIEWAGDGKVVVPLAKAFEDTLYKLYKPSLG